MDSTTTVATGKVNEKELFSIKLPPYFVAKVGSLAVFADGLFHVVKGLGLFATVHGAEAMSMSQFQVAAQAAHAAAFSWVTLGWGMLMLFIGLAMYRHFRALSEGVKDEQGK